MTDNPIWDWFWLVVVVGAAIFLAVRNPNNSRHLVLSIGAAVGLFVIAVLVIAFTST